jgi:hypothetical protein
MKGFPFWEAFFVWIPLKDTGIGTIFGLNECENPTLASLLIELQYFRYSLFYRIFKKELLKRI